MRLAARYADEINFSSIGPEQLSEKIARFDDVCREVGGGRERVTRSVMVSALVGATQAEVGERCAELFREVGGAGDVEAWFAQRAPRWILGTPDEARAMVSRFEAAGAERIMLQDFLPRDLEMIDLLGRELVKGMR